MSRTLADLRWPAVVLALGGLAFLAWERTCRVAEQAPASALREAGEAVGAIAERFRSGRITTTFTAALPRLHDEGNLLELASFEATETFTRADSRAVFFDLIPLGTTVSEIRVPVTYRYHVRLNDPWQLDVRGQVCSVQAPRLRPTLPPALHTERLEKRVQSGWLRFDAREQMEALERSLTPAVSARASDPATVVLVRERCRRQVAEFVRDWLLREEHWGDGRFTAVSVAFADEPAAAAAAHPPTLRYERRP
jgi:hypothetical protein